MTYMPFQPIGPHADYGGSGGVHGGEPGVRRGLRAEDPVGAPAARPRRVLDGRIYREDAEHRRSMLKGDGKESTAPRRNPDESRPHRLDGLRASRRPPRIPRRPAQNGITISLKPAKSLVPAGIWRCCLHFYSSGKMKTGGVFQLFYLEPTGTLCLAKCSGMPFWFARLSIHSYEYL
jgi:hypothetical protein